MTATRVIAFILLTLTQPLAAAQWSCSAACKPKNGLTIGYTGDHSLTYVTATSASARTAFLALVSQCGTENFIFNNIAALYNSSLGITQPATLENSCIRED